MMAEPSSSYDWDIQNIILLGDTIIREVEPCCAHDAMGDQQSMPDHVLQPYYGYDAENNVLVVHLYERLVASISPRREILMLYPSVRSSIFGRFPLPLCR